MVTKWQALKDFLRIQAFRRGSFAVLVVGPLGQRRVQFNGANLEMQMGYVLAVCPLAYRPDTFPGVDAITNRNGDVVEMRVLNVEHANGPFERVHSQPLYPLIGPDDDDAAPTAVYGGVRNDPREHTRDRVAQVGVAPGFEIEVATPVVFTVLMKVAGVEKARVTAKGRPGT